MESIVAFLTGMTLLLQADHAIEILRINRVKRIVMTRDKRRKSEAISACDLLSACIRRYQLEFLIFTAIIEEIRNRYSAVTVDFVNLTNIRNIFRARIHAV